MGVSPVGPSSLLTRQLQDSWRNLRRVSGASPTPTGRRLPDSLLFEVTDASVVQDSSSKYVVSFKRPGENSAVPPHITYCKRESQRVKCLMVNKRRGFSVLRPSSNRLQKYRLTYRFSAFHWLSTLAITHTLSRNRFEAQVALRWR